MPTTDTPSTTPAPPPALVIYQIAIGHYFSRALGLVAKLRLADLLGDGPRHAEDLARHSETHAPSLRRVLRLLATVGVFEEREDGAFALTPVGEALRADVPGSMRASAVLFGMNTYESWRDLEYSLRTGQPVFRKDNPDGSPFDSMDAAAAAEFDAAMAAFTAQTAVAVAHAYDFSRFGTLCDVGGGNGALLIGILRATPAPRGIVFDQPAAAERAKAEIAKAGLAGRCEAVGGSFFEKVPAAADAYLMKHVIHDWDDERATAILKVCRAAMPRHAKVLIVEGVYPPRVDGSFDSRGAAANDVNMLVCTGGRQRSEEEFRALYAGAGFRLARIVPTPARVSVIEGEPA
jgi:hypothetical protein